MNKAITLLIFLLITIGCNNVETKNEYGFYFWRTKLSLTNTEQQILDNSSVPNLYTRFFDVTKTNGVFSEVGIITVDHNLSFSKNIVPVIFITNETWIGIKPEEIILLANKINTRIKIIQAQNNLTLGNEIQIDSDWTETTKKDYFKFLTILKNVSGKEITCTLRLHQVKDKVTMGVPPVNKMYLMCYATSSPITERSKNSILDIGTLKSYLKNINNYPIKLDIALPIYSWGIVTNHVGKKKLINALTNDELLKNPNFTKNTDGNFLVVNDHFFSGMYLNKGFTIKIEEISEKELLESITFIQAKIDYPFHIIYYHLDDRFTKNYKSLFL